MAGKRFPRLDGYSLNASRDLPDNRDLFYTPPPIQLKDSMNRPGSLHILDQQSEGACTGFALAAVINRLNQQRGSRTRVSARMLYEMARKHDEWPGEDYEGSSCRGVVKGFANMGVCRESYWRYNANRPGTLSVRAAKDARNNTLGAYYRLRPRVSDFHSALNEAGVILCSAQVHRGWGADAIRSDSIPRRDKTQGAHAFAIVGYTRKGFWVQNSWGRGWGKAGTALWSYEDWFENLVDAWVVGLALPTPQIWHLGSGDRQSQGHGRVSGLPPRGRIAGHFVHIDDGHFHDSGRYWSNLEDIRTTANNLAKSNSYDHLLVYAHGGLNSPKDSATRIAQMRDVFKDNGIYPLHVMYDTGIAEEIKDIVLGRQRKLGERTGGIGDWWDKLIERVTRKLGRALWREMKFDAGAGFANGNAGAQTLQAFVDALSKGSQLNLNFHLAGHSTGGILLAHLLEAMEDIAPQLRISTCSLLAPAATMAMYKRHFQGRIADPASPFGIDQMTIYNLNDALEKDDHVAQVYRKSLLYLVSRAFEEDTPAPILGMQRYSRELEGSSDRLEIVYSHGNEEREPRTRSTSHGGFDNDPATMNDMLRRILGHKPKRPFTESDLDY